MPIYKVYSTSPNRPTALGRGASRVRVAAPGNVNLATPGATIDGVTLAVDEEFLAPNQSTPAQDGIYVFKGASTAAVRSDALPAGAEARGIQVIVEEGTFADRLYVCTNNDGADVVGTNDLVFREQVAASRKLLQFGQPNVLAGDNAAPPLATPVVLGWGGVTTIAQGWVAPRAGFISALSAGLTEPAAGSGLIVGVYKNGTLVAGAEVTLTDVATNQGTFTDYLFAFVAGDVLDVRIRAGSGWSATTADLAVGLEVTY